jgi:RecA/RadA recombinase
MAKKRAAKKMASPQPVKKAKRKGLQPSIWVGPEREHAVDQMFAAAVQAVRDATELDGLYLGSEMDAVHVGLPLPALCLRYFFQSTVFPLGRVIQLAGPFGSCKTAFLDELMRWHMVYGGGGAIAECEGKDASLMRHGILDYNPVWLRRIEYGEANKLEDWQQFLTASLIQFQTVMDMPGGPGRTIPILFGVDSLTAVDTATEIAKVAEAGHSSLGYATQANLITRFMRQGVVGRLRGYPFTICGTNHLKIKMEAPRPGMPPGTKTPGGEAVNFMATFLVEMHRVKDISTAHYEGIRVSFKLEKNGIGPGRKKFEAQLLWWWEPDETGETRQRFAWDWHTATIELLLSFSEPKSTKKTLGQALKDITGIVKDSASQSHSRVLGITEPTENRIVGQALEARPDLLAQLYPLLGINRYSVFEPGMDYLAMLDRARHTVAEAAPIYDTATLPELDAEQSGASPEFTPEDEETPADDSGSE